MGGQGAARIGLFQNFAQSLQIHFGVAGLFFQRGIVALRLAELVKQRILLRFGVDGVLLRRRERLRKLRRFAACRIDFRAHLFVGAAEVGDAAGGGDKRLVLDFAETFALRQFGAGVGQFAEQRFGAFEHRLQRRLEPGQRLDAAEKIAVLPADRFGLVAELSERGGGEFRRQFHWFGFLTLLSVHGVSTALSSSAQQRGEKRIHGPYLCDASCDFQGFPLNLFLFF